MKTLLIPTDFKLSCLPALHRLLQQYQPNRVNIILVHMLKITDSIQELMMLSRRSSEYRMISDEFHQACALLKQSYPQIADMRLEFFYGSTLAVFNNFLEANSVDNIVMFENYKYHQLAKNSIPPSLLVNRAQVPIVKVSCLPLEVQATTPPDATLIDEIL
ncbi:hypothetical protein [Mucilaginibacter lacusdianchii]|uniref:hypothetical protein n=1 Tax=Mucilaginibacter lacusdianchii TaxID=2684211 RepID=UPI00131B1414|nr:hypothetical protein [Mucilaginibacter sp. JXJ CY 39]